MPKKKRRKRKNKPKQQRPIGFNGAFCLVAKKLNLDMFLLLSIAKTESGLNPKLKNDDRLGLFQITLKQARQLSDKITEEDLVQPIFNIEIGARLFKKYFRATRRLRKDDEHRDLWPWEIALLFWSNGDWEFVKKVKGNYWILVKNIGEVNEDCRED